MYLLARTTDTAGIVEDESREKEGVEREWAEQAAMQT